MQVTLYKVQFTKYAPKSYFVTTDKKRAEEIHRACVKSLFGFEDMVQTVEEVIEVE
jgi:hypothetical protein